MLIGKKKKIAEYLRLKTDNDKCVFDVLLSDYLGGVLKNDLAAVGMKKIQIHVDWLDDIKCIAIQGRYKEYYMDLQIDLGEFSLSFDLDEPDENVLYSLESKDQLYCVIKDTIKAL